MKSSHNYIFFVRCMIFVGILCFAGTALSQVVIEKQHIQNIFTPGGAHFYTVGVEGNFNIGKPGGPNVYDFSSFGLQNLSTSNNYEVSSVPALAPHYTAGAVTFGDSPTTIEKNPVFLFGVDTVFVLGQASLIPAYQFVHYAPAEIMAIFPTVYGTTFSQDVTRYDTTFGSGGAVVAVNHSSSQEVTTIDGYGTLKLSGMEYQCIRVKKEHRGYGDKEFIYMTREGAFMLVGGVTLTAPDTGIVSGGAQLLVGSTLANVETPEEIPGSFALHQNHPNPFNPTTVVSFQLSVASDVKLVVYDLLGREVAVLVNEKKAPGTHSVRFDGSGLSSGVYFYRLTAGTFVQCRKMLLLG